MPQNNTGVKDTVNSLWLTSYNSDPTLCGWGNANNAVLFSEEAANAEAAALNDASGVDTCIGQNPPPR